MNRIHNTQQHYHKLFTKALAQIYILFSLALIESVHRFPCPSIITPPDIRPKLNSVFNGSFTFYVSMNSILYVLYTYSERMNLPE